MDIQTGTGKYRITADDRCWTLSRIKVREKGDNAGTEYATDQTYHIRFDTLADKLARMAIQDDKTGDIEKSLSRIALTLAALMPPYKHVTEEAA